MIIAAGYDTRAYRLASPGVRFYEIDLPHASKKKQELVAEHMPQDKVRASPHRPGGTHELDHMATAAQIALLSEGHSFNAVHWPWVDVSRELHGELLDSGLEGIRGGTQQHAAGCAVEPCSPLQPRRDVHLLSVASAHLVFCAEGCHAVLSAPCRAVSCCAAPCLPGSAAAAAPCCTRAVLLA